MERLILVRHAESVFNVRGVLNGDPSIPGGLTDLGREQATRLAERLADEPIDMCVTTEFQRTRETAAIALARREVPRMVMSELNDPPNGDLELRPYGELARWRESHGPDDVLPGSGMSERDYFAAVARGFRLLMRLPQPDVLAVLHGYVVSWITSSVGAPAPGRHAEASTLTRSQLADGLDLVEHDVFTRWSWETSGRPLLDPPQMAADG
jgi:broad specificity phosphatase PhoE